MPDLVGALTGEVASGPHPVASPRDGAVFYSDDGDKNRAAAEAYVKAQRLTGKEATTLEQTLVHHPVCTFWSVA